MRKFKKGDKARCCYKDASGRTRYAYGTVAGYRGKHTLLDIGCGMPLLCVYGNKMVHVDSGKEEEYQKLVKNHSEPDSKEKQIESNEKAVAETIQASVKNDDYGIRVFRLAVALNIITIGLLVIKLLF